MRYRVEFSAEFKAWLNGLNDLTAKEAISRRIVRVEIGNFGDHTSVGDGVSELRIHVGQGYRAYYTIRGRIVVFMLLGGTKRTQDRDIVRAKQMAREI